MLTVLIEPIAVEQDVNAAGPEFPIGNPFPRTELYNEKYLKVSDGWLIALDAGEWGAWFGWYSDSGETHYKISEARVRKFEQINGQLYVMGGGCGGNAGKYGFIALIQQKQDRWAFERFVEFPDCVLAITETVTMDRNRESSLLVLTSSLIYEISPTSGKTLLFGHLGWSDPEHGNWMRYQPNSVARDVYENFFIGTDYGVIGILRNRGSKEYPMAFD